MDFLTAEEKQRLEERLAALIAKRPEISRRIGEAAALGDLSENAEYHAAREDQGLMEAEIRRIEERIKTAIVADKMEMPADVVFIGATVRLREIETGDEDVYKLVGEATGNFSLDYFEVTGGSPMGEALMKARVGETIRVDTPKGAKRFEILELL
ncbi:MAG: transcription elongation factor GreA [Phycisphaerales bacterium]|nr:transcription elongation factor GreA [Phycisphaerales bacterium]